MSRCCYQGCSSCFSPLSSQAPNVSGPLSLVHFSYSLCFSSGDGMPLTATAMNMIGKIEPRSAHLLGDSGSLQEVLNRKQYLKHNAGQMLSLYILHTSYVPVLQVLISLCRLAEI